MRSAEKVIEVEGVGGVPHAAVEFFALFSRFEFALLASGYVGGNSGENAWANWDQFAKDLHEAFYSEANSDPEIAFIFQYPPRKLVYLGNGECKFVDGERIEDARTLLLSIRTIRNNLFHGSKVLFSTRDLSLISAGIRALRLALDVVRLLPTTRKVETAWTYADFDVA